ncbi:hypothetical protein KKB44_03355 [Candidatus Micrarchaeota archaeon]|nr:hypothetical protein [Candidatus Micrarchaeota archaeon]
MTDAIICAAEFGDFFNSTIIPLVAYATVITGILIALSFMVGRAIANPKLTLWAKTEAVQIVISLASIFFILTIINVFCAIDMVEIGSFFGVTVPTGSSISVYDAAQEYLRESALYSHNAMTTVRYHLEGLTILSFLNYFQCDFPIGPIGLGCWYGYSGTNMQPVGGYGAAIASLNIFFNSSNIAHFSALNFMFILLFVYKGFVFVFLPLGLFLRSMPYMRSFGSLFIAVAMSFLIIYPLMLGILYLMGDVLVDRPTDCLACPSPDPGGYIPESDPDLRQFLNEDVFSEHGGAGGSIAQTLGGAFAGEALSEYYYFENGTNITGSIQFAAYAFIAAVFMPTAALIATIASISYIARLYGEEIDLSRITQLM